MSSPESPKINPDAWIVGQPYEVIVTGEDGNPVNVVLNPVAVMRGKWWGPKPTQVANYEEQVSH